MKLKNRIWMINNETFSEKCSIYIYLQTDN